MVLRHVGNFFKGVAITACLSLQVAMATDVKGFELKAFRGTFSAGYFFEGKHALQGAALHGRTFGVWTAPALTINVGSNCAEGDQACLNEFNSGESDDGTRVGFFPVSINLDTIVQTQDLDTWRRARVDGKFAGLIHVSHRNIVSDDEENGTRADSMLDVVFIPVGLFAQDDKRVPLKSIMANIGTADLNYRVGNSESVEAEFTVGLPTFRAGSFDWSCMGEVKGDYALNFINAAFRLGVSLGMHAKLSNRTSYQFTSYYGTQNIQAYDEREEWAQNPSYDQNYNTITRDVTLDHHEVTNRLSVDEIRQLPISLAYETRYDAFYYRFNQKIFDFSDKTKHTDIWTHMFLVSVTPSF